jgi:YD repeat-containing protein
MKKVLSMFILSLLVVSLVVAGRQTDKDQVDLTGPVRTIGTVSLAEGPGSWREGQRIVTTYDNKGNESEIAFYNSSDAGGSLYERAVHIYDAQGKRTATHYNSGRKTLYTYNAQGQLTEQISCAAFSCFDKIAYTYDSEGNLSEESFYDPGGSSIKLRLVHTYDAQGCKTKTESYDTHDPALGIEKTVQTYDPNGNVLDLTAYYTHKVGEIEGHEVPSPSKMVYTYEWDAHGNWVKQTQFLCPSDVKAGQPPCDLSLVTYRTLTYYPKAEKP